MPLQAPRFTGVVAGSVGHARACCGFRPNPSRRSSPKAPARTWRRGMPVEAAMSIFDLACDDFGFQPRSPDRESCRHGSMACRHRRAALDEQRCRPGARLKKNTPAASNDVSVTDSNIAFDKIIRLPGRPAASQTDPFGKNGCCICVKLDTGRTITLFDNDLDRPADGIADLTKTRWQIEILLPLTEASTCASTSSSADPKDAVRLQIAAEMIPRLSTGVRAEKAGSRAPLHRADVDLPSRATVRTGRAGRAAATRTAASAGAVGNGPDSGGPHPDVWSRQALQHPTRMLRSTHVAFFQPPRVPRRSWAVSTCGLEGDDAGERAPPHLRAGRTETACPGVERAGRPHRHARRRPRAARAPGRSGRRTPKVHPRRPDERGGCSTSRLGTVQPRRIIRPGRSNISSRVCFCASSSVP